MRFILRVYITNDFGLNDGFFSFFILFFYCVTFQAVIIIVLHARFGTEKTRSPRFFRSTKIIMIIVLFYVILVKYRQKRGGTYPQDGTRPAQAAEKNNRVLYLYISKSIIIQCVYFKVTGNITPQETSITSSKSHGAWFFFSVTPNTLHVNYNIYWTLDLC